MLVRVFFGLNNNGPAGRENTAVNVELIGFEEVAPEDGHNSQVLAIWQMYNVRTWWHAVLLEPVLKVRYGMPEGWWYLTILIC